VITVRVSADSIVVSGHSGYAEAGSDIVCAGVSSATELLSIALELMEIDHSATADERSATVAFRVDARLAICRAYRLHIAKIAEDYPKYVKLEDII
jgi:uncharacterized protein YsxB (DUF464 family)